MFLGLFTAAIIYIYQSAAAGYSVQLSCGAPAGVMRLQSTVRNIVDFFFFTVSQSEFLLEEGRLFDTKKTTL